MSPRRDFEESTALCRLQRRKCYIELLHFCTAATSALRRATAAGSSYRILNELNGSFSGRNDIGDRLCRYPLLIIDDFGIERGTEYALEQIYNIVDSRYRSQKPLIVTTNLTLDEIRHPQDTAHARIYDRLLEMCIPVSCIGVSFRKENAQEKLKRMKLLIG